MELRYLRYFMAVAEELHFRKAAERLHIAQPALSMQIKDLEEMLGGLLFERTNRSVKLTSAGEIFYREAKEALKQVERAVKATQYALKGELGCVKIAYSGNAVFSGLLGDIIHNFREEHPEVEFELTEANPVKQMQDLTKRDIHVGFLTTLSLNVPQELEGLLLASWPLVLAMPPNHKLAGCKKITVDMLKAEPFVVYAGAEEWGSASMIDYLCGFEPNVAYQAENVMLMLALVSAGLGLALLPDSLKGRFPNIKTVFKPVAGLKKAQMDCSLLWNKQEPEPAMKVFVETIKAFKHQRL